MGPALPWGTHPAAHTAVPDLTGRVIEIKWALVDDETNETTIKWWRAEVQARDGEPDAQGRSYYTIRYAADDGFSEETSRVVIFDEHVLYDAGNEEELVWRLAGDTWDEPPPEAGATAGAGSEPGIISGRDIANAISIQERLEGKTLEQDAAEELARLPPERQRAMAAGMQALQAVFTAGIQELYARNGPGYVVTPQDIEDIKRRAMLLSGAAQRPGAL